MPVRKLAALMIAVVTSVIGGQHASAQETPPDAWGEPDGIIDFETDWRWFEPAYNADIDELSPKKRANHGFFFTFDRCYLKVNRPTTEQSYTDGDWGWANRIDFGHMAECDRGWSATVFNLTGPNAYITNLQNRANVINTDDPFLTGSTTTATVPTNPYGEMLPARDRNNRNFWERVYQIQDSLNVLSIKGFEMNRTWRLEPYRLGGILEPLIGLRYVKLTATDLKNDYTVGPGTLLDDDGDLSPNIHESYGTDLIQGKNEMYGGQLGFRYTKNKRRFTNSLDLRAFALQNFQNSTYTQQRIDTYYDETIPGEISAPVLYENKTLGKSFKHGGEFVFGFDLRAESALQITRSINLRAGVQVMDFAKGVLRGSYSRDSGASSKLSSTDADTDQNVWLVGYTFGVTINR